MEKRSKYVQAVKETLIRESSFPSVELVRYFADRICSSSSTEQTIDEFGPIVKEALNYFVGEQTVKALVTEKPSVGSASNSYHMVSDEEFESFFVVNVAERL